jgi:hypothetical protein
MSKYIYRMIHTFLLLAALGSLVMGFATLVMCVMYPSQVAGPHLGTLGLTALGFVSFLCAGYAMESVCPPKGWEFGKLEHKDFNPPAPSQWGGQVPTHEVKIGVGGTGSVTENTPNKVRVTGKNAKGVIMSEEVTLNGTEPVILKGPWI